MRAVTCSCASRVFGAFAVVRPSEHDGDTSLMHGNTMHGLELARDYGSKRARPTLYYARSGPMGDVIALAQSREESALRVGVNDGGVAPKPTRAPGAPLLVALVELGAGTLAAYAVVERDVAIFEIDPAVVRIAEDPLFHVSPRRIRRSRRRRHRRRAHRASARPVDLGLLVVDAFTSDAIPTHLLTREAFAMYRQKLSSRAPVAWHISNRHLDLSRRRLAALVDDAHWSLLIRNDGEWNREGKSASTWVVASSASAEARRAPRARLDRRRAPRGFPRLDRRTRIDRDGVEVKRTEKKLLSSTSCSR